MRRNVYESSSEPADEAVELVLVWRKRGCLYVDEDDDRRREAVESVESPMPDESGRGIESEKAGEGKASLEPDDDSDEEGRTSGAEPGE